VKEKMDLEKEDPAKNEEIKNVKEKMDLEKENPAKPEEIE
jgi:hypothetical protein